MVIRKIIKYILSPSLIFVTKRYLGKERTYSYNGIKIIVSPGVFHPGLFFSTKILLSYISDYDLKGKRVLELGAGSGLISIFAAKKGALVTASDISNIVINCLHKNSTNNNVIIDIVKSDVFDQIPDIKFDLVIINPPYYPYNPKNENEYAWFCGEDFLYFRKLFCQLKKIKNPVSEIIMILSEDCSINQIKDIANENGIELKLNSTVKNWYEENYIFTITFRS
jgi:release factor glutamine methyltransferase